jgi:hypothetical protein
MLYGPRGARKRDLEADSAAVADEDDGWQLLP